MDTTRLSFYGEGGEMLGEHGYSKDYRCFQCLETLIHVLKVVALPHAAHAGSRDRKSTLPQLVGNTQLTKGGLFDGKHNNGVFDLLWHAILQHWLLAADLLQRQLAAFFVEFLEANASSPSFCMPG
jgi:hypothetical protein